MSAFTITPEGFKQFSAYLENSCGILLADNKQYLVQSRLAKIMKENALSQLEELVKVMSSPSGRGLKDKIVDAMTTNETLWFRDSHPYDVLTKKLFPIFLDRPTSRMKIWSTACSTGQEPYSISMVANEYIEKKQDLRNAAVDIVATDISPTVLEAAKKGEYEMFALGRGLSKERQEKFFKQTSNDSWQVNQKIKSSVNFRSLNLLDSYTMVGKFDVIFCRNVLIYFSSDLKHQILTKLHAQLKPNGYLILGASESMSGLSDKFEMVHCHPGIIYKSK